MIVLDYIMEKKQLKRQENIKKIVFLNEETIINNENLLIFYAEKLKSIFKIEEKEQFICIVVIFGILLVIVENQW